VWIGAGVYGKVVEEKAETRIGIFQLFDQTRYDEAIRGIVDQLKQDGFVEPTTKVMIEKAMSSYVRGDELIRKLAAARMDIIVTLGTQGSVAITKVIKDIPVVFSVVYDPVEAGLVQDWDKPGTNATGTSTKIPMAKIMETLEEMAPVKKLAVLYTPGEKNSEAQLAALQALGEASPIKVEPVPMPRKQNVALIMHEVVHTADAIYLTGSSIVNEALPIIVGAAGKEKLITITHLDDLVVAGVLVGICADSYLEGRMAGEKIVQILKGAKPSAIPVGTPQKVDVILNKKTAVEGQFVIPTSFLAKVTKTIE
jgi:putative ABC transport system substrate-binding protein